jgi:hypothetical protein
MVWHSVDREDFLDTNELRVRRQLEGGTWAVCSEYELKELMNVGTLPWEHEYPPYEISAKHLQGFERREWREYRPLEEKPDLFLEFARLYDKGFSTELILEWVRRHGKLGHNRFPQPGAGNRETARAFWGEVSWAAGVLAMYEVALNGNARKAKQLAQEKFHFLAPEYMTRQIKGGVRSPTGNFKSPLSKETGDEAAEISGIVETHFDGDYLAYALDVATWAVESVVRESCYPTLRLNVGLNELTHDPSRIAGGWGFKNLLGAIYLQMYWLMEAGANVTRCRYCGRIISFAAPRPGQRKARSDKKYCNKSCRQNHDYDNRVKPQRQGKRAQK